MKSYELTLVMNPELAKDQQEGVIAGLKKHIEAADGKIDKVDDWGKKQLAYPIDGFSEGAYFFVVFSIPAQKLANLEKNARLNDNVIRHLIVAKGE